MLVSVGRRDIPTKISLGVIQIPTNDGKRWTIPGTGSAGDENMRYRQGAHDARGRMGPDTDYTQGDVAANSAIDSRIGQAGALAMIQQRAAGGGPSAAGLMMGQGNDQIAQQQIAAMAGAGTGVKGGAGFSRGLALQNAATSGAGMYGNNVMNAGQARVGEISGAQGSMFGGYGQMRDTDLGQMRMQDARSQHMANMIMGQRGLNQQTGLNYEGMGQDVRNAQLNANIYNRMQYQRHKDAQNQMDLASKNNSSAAEEAGANGVTGIISGGMAGGAGG